MGIVLSGRSPAKKAEDIWAAVQLTLTHVAHRRPPGGWGRDRNQDQDQDP